MQVVQKMQAMHMSCFKSLGEIFKFFAFFFRIYTFFFENNFISELNLWPIGIRLQNYDSLIKCSCAKDVQTFPFFWMSNFFSCHSANICPWKKDIGTFDGHKICLFKLLWKTFQNKNKITSIELSLKSPSLHLVFGPIFTLYPLF